MVVNKNLQDSVFMRVSSAAAIQALSVEGARHQRFRVGGVKALQIVNPDVICGLLPRHACRGLAEWSRLGSRRDPFSFSSTLSSGS